MILGVGIDAVDSERFRRAMERWGERLSGRLFTDSELRYCLARRRPERHLAARFAAKMSVFKAVGRRLRFRDVEISRADGGRPVVRVVGMDGGIRLSVSIAHDGVLCIAETVAEDMG